MYRRKRSRRERRKNRIKAGSAQMLHETGHMVLRSYAPFAGKMNLSERKQRMPEDTSMTEPDAGDIKEDQGLCKESAKIVVL